MAKKNQKAAAAEVTEAPVEAVAPEQEAKAETAPEAKPVKAKDVEIPTIGRIVHIHLQEYPGAPRLFPHAAIVSHVEADGKLNLAVFLKSGRMEARENVKHSATPADGCWCWPAKV